LRVLVRVCDSQRRCKRAGQRKGASMVSEGPFSIHMFIRRA
jgi:hypothetical protein